MLVALHGFTENDTVWSEALAPAQLACRCVLLPGHGHKPCPPTMTFAGYVDELARSLPSEPFDLLGYSMGGRMALALAIAHPQRIRRLVLVSSAAGMRDAAERDTRHRRDERLAQMLEDEGIGPFVAVWEGSAALRPVQPFTERVAEMMRYVRLSHDPIGLASCLRVFGQGANPMLWDALPGLNIPTLLLAGDADHKYATLMAEMAGKLPQGRLVRIPDSGHSIHREQPYALRTEVGRFLA